MYTAIDLRAVSEKSEVDLLEKQATVDKQRAEDYLNKLDELMMEFAKKGLTRVEIVKGHSLNIGYWDCSKTVRGLINKSLNERDIIYDFSGTVHMSWAKK